MLKTEPSSVQHLLRGGQTNSETTCCLQALQENSLEKRYFLEERNTVLESTMAKDGAARGLLRETRVGGRRGHQPLGHQPGAC